MVKYIKHSVPILFTVLIVIFAAFGEEIYRITKPILKETKVKFTIINGEEMTVIPKTAYTGDSVFTVIESEGFMITHNVLKRIPVTVSGIQGETDYYRVISGVKVGDRIIDSVEECYYDGQKVIIG